MESKNFLRQKHSQDKHIKQLIKTIYKFLDYQVENYREEGFFLCLSGGIDSTTLLKLIVDRYGPKSVIGFTTTLDNFNNPKDIEDTKELCKDLGVKQIVKNITKPVKVFLETLPEVKNHPLDNIAGRIRMGMACELSVKYNVRLLFAAPFTEWIFSGIPIGCDSAHAYPFSGLFKAEILAIAEHIGVPKKFLLKKPGNSAVGKRKIDRIKTHLGVPFSDIDKMAAFMDGLIPREAINHIDTKQLMCFEFLKGIFEPEIDIRGLCYSFDLNTKERKEFLTHITKFPFEKKQVEEKKVMKIEQK